MPLASSLHKWRKLPACESGVSFQLAIPGCNADRVLKLSDGKQDAYPTLLFDQIQQRVDFGFGGIDQ